jgi:quinol monooxygenase YgiN
MFGTIAVVKPKPGQEQAVSDMFEHWWDVRRPQVKGAIASTVYRSSKNPEELMMALVFDTRANYEANANDPEQAGWYEKLLDLLDGEPRWIDSEIPNRNQSRE